MSFIATLVLSVIICLLIQLSMLVDTCKWRRLINSAVSPLDNQNLMELGHNNAVNSTNNNSFQSKDYSIKTNCFLTYTALLIMFCVNIFLVITFGHEKTLTFRNMIHLVMYAAIPLFRIYKNEKIQNYVKLCYNKVSQSH